MRLEKRNIVNPTPDLPLNPSYFYSTTLLLNSQLLLSTTPIIRDSSFTSVPTSGFFVLFFGGGGAWTGLPCWIRPCIGLCDESRGHVCHPPPLGRPRPSLAAAPQSVGLSPRLDGRPCVTLAADIGPHNTVTAGRPRCRWAATQLGRDGVLSEPWRGRLADSIPTQHRRAAAGHTRHPAPADSGRFENCIHLMISSLNVRL